MRCIRLMFRKRVLFVLFTLVTGIVYYLVTLFQVTDEDVNVYAALIESSTPKPNSQKGVARQQRNIIHKEIWVADSVERLHYSLRGQHSELLFSNDGAKTAMVEYMDDVSCFMQEELFFLLADGREVVRKPNGRLLLRHANPKKAESWIKEDGLELTPMQKIRYLKAEKGIYYYSTNTFIANEVQLQRFVAPGHELVETLVGIEPTMTGVAKSVEFSLDGHALNFKAHHLKATFFTQKGLM